MSILNGSLPNFWSTTSKMAPSKFGGITKKPATCQVGKLCKETATAVPTNKKKNAEFTLERCTMLVDIGLVPLEFYLYGSEDSDKVDEHQDNNTTQSVTGTRRNATQSLTETTHTVTQSLTATTINVALSLASTSSKIAEENNNKVEEDQDVLADDDRKPAAVIFATVGNVTQPLVVATCNDTQSLAATIGTATHTTTGNETQSLAGTGSDVAHSASNVAQSPLAATRSAGHSPTFTQANNETRSLTATDSNIAESLTAMDIDVAQSLAATTINVAQSLTSTARNVTPSLAATAINVSQSNVGATGSVAHSTTFTEANTEAELASFSPDTITEDTAARELLLEMHPLTPQVINTLLAIFHPIICLQPLTVLPFHSQMILPLGNFWKKIAK
jgi:hypothetical protein